ncbi:MAG: DEAD/DEAH box helicase, partial [Treponema sp.]|nr:DEAD/DEAH box helicase [Treponema sp.]
MAFPLPFHPLINEWFLETYKTPTPVQEEAWPLIVEGEHVLAIAPTGSGKTLTAFLAAISRFASGTYDAGKLSVLYVSPLKALNEDIRRNLTLPLEGIRAHFEKAGKAIPDIRVQTRSGDTPQEERRRFLSMPPSILALTPESLAILLHNPRGREVLSGVRFLIIDEIHAALGSKRGCFLSCQIDRLAMVAGEFQRVALSATVKPPETAAAFVGGIGIGYAPRKVRIVRPAGKKAIDFQVEFPESDSESDETSGEESAEKSSGAHIGKRYVSLVEFIIARIKANPPGASILVFADARRRAERIAYFLNQTAAADSAFSGQPIAYAHHGSLAKDVRREVEKALASGEIPCVVATGSLELGIDIGGVEEVILAGSPSSAATALQRVGRSGHGVGQTSRGWLVPFHGIDLLQATALSGAVQDREIEETQSIENPLDILAQIILSLCAEREWNEDELYETLRGFYVYQTLSRFNYNGVIRMLSGAYESAYPSKSAEPDKIERLRELKRRIFFDEETKTLSAAPGALPLLYTSGGVITSKGYYSMRLAAVAGNNDGGTKIGELD